MRLRALVAWAWVSVAVAAGQPVNPGGGSPDRTAVVDPALEARLAEIDTRIGAIEDLRAAFEQRRHAPLLKAPMVSSGRVVLKAQQAVSGDASRLGTPPRVRWDTERPRKSVMTIERGEVRIYDPEAAVVEVYSVEGSLGEFSGSPLPRLETLRRLFAIAPLDPAVLGVDSEVERDRFVGVELTPSGEELREHVTRVRVVLDSHVPCVRIIDIEDADGERTEIRFSEVRVNTGVREAELMLDVPPGTRVSRPRGGEGEGAGGARDK